MPRATSQKFSRVHQAAAKPKATSTSGQTASNPLFNTDLGQHILKSPQVAQNIVDKANLRPTDHVLEVGPGTGNLTVRILEKSKHVTAVEMDPRLAAELTKRVQGTPSQRKLELILGDFVKADLPHFDVCISNTPYQISSPLVFRLLSQRPIPRIAILMFQREFALRLCAMPGTSLWSRLSANVQLYATVDHLFKVSRNDFRPPPKVESSVVRMKPKDPPPPIRFEEWDGMNRIIFGRRNGTVRKAFLGRGVEDILEKNWRTWCAENDKPADESVSMKVRIENVLTETGFGESRAAKMTIDDLLKLLSAFHDIGVHFS